MDRKLRKNLETTVRMVEGVLRDLGLTPDDNRLDAEHPAWGIAKGSAEVFIFINPTTTNEHHSIQCISPVLKLPQEMPNRLGLFQRLLQLNADQLSGAAFGLRGDTIVVIADRTTLDLDPSEVKQMILRVGYFADVFDDELSNEYGGRRHAD